MSRVFRIRVTIDRAPGSWRVLELSEEQSLHALHLKLLESFGFDAVHLYSFFQRRILWDPRTEIGSPDSGTPRRADRIVLGALGLQPGRELFYVYDFIEEHVFRLLVSMSSELDGAAGICELIASYGPAPLQYDWEGRVDPDWPESEGGFLDDALDPSGLHSRTGAEPPPASPADSASPAADAELVGLRRRLSAGHSREVSKPALLDAYAAALEVRQRLRNGGWDWLGGAAGVEAEELLDSISRLPYELEQRGLLAEALELCEQFASLEDPLAFAFMVDRAGILARQGRRTEAIAQIQRNLERFPQDSTMLRHAADLYLDLGELLLAEQLYRRCLEEPSWFEEDRIETLRRLAAVLARTARTDEGRHLLGAVELKERVFKSLRHVGNEPPFRSRRSSASSSLPTRATPEDPCPCGSGRPYKRCCLN